MWLKQTWNCSGVLFQFYFRMCVVYLKVLNCFVASYHNLQEMCNIDPFVPPTVCATLQVRSVDDMHSSLHVARKKRDTIGLLTCTVQNYTCNGIAVCVVIKRFISHRSCLVNIRLMTTKPRGFFVIFITGRSSDYLRSQLKNRQEAKLSLG